MRYQFVLPTLIAATILSCSSSQPDSPNDRLSQGQSRTNPILGTWRLIPGQTGGEYWPKPCREITFKKRASYCGDTGSPNSYEIRQDEVVVYDDSFEQIYRFPDPDTMTTNIAGVGTLKFDRIN